jgi:Uncharacterized protein containing a NRPS condensation (elongation) domain
MDSSGCSVTVAQENWKDLISTNEKIPFAIEKGELIRAFVIPSEGKMSLLIMAHHLVGDGKAIIYFLEDIMNALSGKKIEYKPFHTFNTDSLPKEAKLPLPIKLYANKLNKKWHRNSTCFDWKDYYKIHKAYWKDRSSQIIYHTFSSEEVRNIRLRAKAMGITVNSYILAAFLKSQKSIRSVGIAISVRSEHNRTMTNQVSGIRINHIYSEKMSFNENAKQIHKKVQKKIRHPGKKYLPLQFVPLFSPTLIDSTLLYTHGLYHSETSKKLAKILGYKNGRTRDLGISNLTRLDMPLSYGSYKIANTLFIPPAISYARRPIGISTLDGVMNISYHFMNDKKKKEEEAFFQRAMEYLQQV